MYSKDEVVIKVNPKKILKYQVLIQNKPYNSFLSEETANKMRDALIEVSEVFMRNEYEKYVYSVQNPNSGCIHK